MWSSSLFSSSSISFTMQNKSQLHHPLLLYDDIPPENIFFIFQSNYTPFCGTFGHLITFKLELLMVVLHLTFYQWLCSEHKLTFYD